MFEGTLSFRDAVDKYGILSSELVRLCSGTVHGTEGYVQAQFCFCFHAHKSETWATIAFVFKMYQLLLLLLLSLFLLLLFLLYHWFKMWTHRAILPRPSQHHPSSGSQGIEILCIFTTLKVKNGTRDFLSWISLQGRITSETNQNIMLPFQWKFCLLEKRLFQTDAQILLKNKDFFLIRSSQSPFKYMTSIVLAFFSTKAEEGKMHEIIKKCAKVKQC